MKRSILLIAALLAALAGTVQAQAPASTDPVVQLRAEQKAVDKTYAAKKKAIDSERKASVKAAGDKAAAEAKAKGAEEGIARRDAEAKIKSATKADYDAKVKALKNERDTATAEIKKKYPAAKS